MQHKKTARKDVRWTREDRHVIYLFSLDRLKKVTDSLKTTKDGDASKIMSACVKE